MTNDKLAILEVLNRYILPVGTHDDEELADKRRSRRPGVTPTS